MADVIYLSTEGWDHVGITFTFNIHYVEPKSNCAADAFPIKTKSTLQKNQSSFEIRYSESAAGLLIFFSNCEMGTCFLYDIYFDFSTNDYITLGAFPISSAWYVKTKWAWFPPQQIFFFFFTETNIYARCKPVSSYISWKENVLRMEGHG